MRAALHLFESMVAPRPDEEIYITEQNTLLYRQFLRRYPKLIGSEYLVGSTPKGQTSYSGFRCEDLTDLTFADAQLDHILTFEVLEHIPDYQAALSECARVLKPGGTLYCSAPFHGSPRHTVRARVLEDGSIEHLLPPEYHGNPIDPDGVLCYRYFGFELLDELRAAGFSDPRAWIYWSAKLGYLGEDRVVFVAERSRSSDHSPRVPAGNSRPRIELGKNRGRILIEKLLEDKPLLHPGQISWAVSPAVLRYFADLVKPNDRTVETGAGYTTVALAALGAHHVSVTSDSESAELTRAYLDKLGIAHKVTWIIEPSDTALPRLPTTEIYDFAYVDGCHSYPLPAIDWHFLDQHLRVGGLIGFDNVEVPSVHFHTEFLRMNGSYRQINKITHDPSNYTVTFYEKLRDEPRTDIAQRFNHRRVTRNNWRDSLKTTLSGWLVREGKPWPWS